MNRSQRLALPFVLASLCTAGTLFASPAPSPLQEPDPWASLPGFEQVVAETVARCAEHSRWAAKHKLLAERQWANEFLIALDPEDRTARKLLGYRRVSGGWEAGQVAEVSNRIGAALKEIPNRRQSIVEPYLEALWEHAQGPGAIDAALEQRIFELDPNHVGLRARRGEEWDALRHTWVLRETLQTIAGRAAIQERLRYWGDSAELLEEELTDEERSWGLSDGVAIQGARVRVVGTTETVELERCARAVESALGWFLEACPPDRPFKEVRFVLLTQKKELEALVRKHPRLEQGNVGPALAASGIWVPKSPTFIVVASRSPRRLEMAIQQSLYWTLLVHHGIDQQQAWLYAGLRTYVSSLLQGTSEELLRDGWPAEAAAVGSSVRAQRLGWSPATREAFEEAAGDWLRQPLTGHLDREDVRRAYASFRFCLELDPSHMVRWLKHPTSEGGAQSAAWEDLRGRLSEDAGRVFERWANEIGQEGRSAETDLDEARSEELLARLQSLPRREREQLYQICLEAIADSGSHPYALVKRWAQGQNPEQLPQPAILQAHDATTYRGPKRRLVSPRAASWRSVRDRLGFGEHAPVERRFDYEFSTAQVVRHEEADGETLDFLALLRGELPDLELAEAGLLAKLDAGRALGEAADYFAHLYCDGEANAYADITWYDAWSHAAQSSMPDTDLRAYAGLLHGKRDLPEELSRSQRAKWLAEVAASFEDLRNHQRVARALARTYFQGSPPLDLDLEVASEVLHGLWVRFEEEPDALRERLEKNPTALLTDGLGELRAEGHAGWTAASERRNRLLIDRQRQAQAVLRVLRDAALL